MSGLDDLYREIILDHYRNPRNRGELEVPPAKRFEGFNPSCGDEVVLYVQIEDDKVADVKITGQGCSISQSSGSMMTSVIKGKSVSDVAKLISAFKSMMSIHEQSLDTETTAPLDDAELVRQLGDLAALRGVVKFPVRIKCATLPWNALSQAIAR